MLTARHGALTVVEQAHPKEFVQARLRELDDRLFLEKQITLSNEEVWCVVVDVGLGHPPMTILEWRDDSGRPIPYLSERIVGRVAQMDRDAGKLYAKVIAANAALVEMQREHALQEWEAISEDMIPRMSGTRSAVLPRGQWLRRSRDRRRARGEKL